MPGVAVKVTEAPAQTGLADAAIATLTGRIGLTVMFTALDVAGFPVVQSALEVRAQVSTLLFAGLNVYMALVAPVTFTEFTFH